ncbi:MAG: SRPBCC domain-containing protein [Novosphingobium sp.]
MSDSQTTDPHELSVTRFIAAPPEKVWHVMAERLTEWWCPLPWRAEFVAREMRPGGRAEMMFHGPDGEQHPQNGIYLAWDEGRRFAITDAITADLMPHGPFMIGIWEIASEADGTRYTATSRHWTAEASEKHQTMGFEAGWGACADQLKALCEA